MSDLVGNPAETHLSVGTDGDVKDSQSQSSSLDDSQPRENFIVNQLLEKKDVRKMLEPKAHQDK